MRATTVTFTAGMRWSGVVPGDSSLALGGPESTEPRDSRNLMAGPARRARHVSVPVPRPHAWVAAPL